MIPSGLPRGIRAYRGFIVGGVKRAFQQRYRNALPAAAKTELNPRSDIARL